MPRPSSRFAPGLLRQRPGLLLLAVGFCSLHAAGCSAPAHKQRKQEVKPQPSLAGMVFVPAGDFRMGRDSADAADNERPEHVVWLDEFYIDKTEATNAQFKAFCDATNRLYPNNPHWDGNYFLGKPDHPVINITYEQARAYCSWQGKRLPTEAEWEKAARGTDGRLFPWGNDWREDAANLAGDSTGADTLLRLAPVGSFLDGASPYGALDMIGNVWEWCADWYDTNYYAQSPSRNPPGPVGPAPRRVVRGGGFTSPRQPSGDTTVSYRDKNPPNLPRYLIGCRCVWSPDRP